MSKYLNRKRTNIYEYSSEKNKIKKIDENIYEKVNEKIDENHTDTESKIQELNARMLILTRSVSAVLDGLKQQGCNGQVTKAKEELDAFLMERAYD